MNQMIGAYVDSWASWKDFSGRSRRSAFWYAILANAIAVAILTMLGGILAIFSILLWVYDLLYMVPCLALYTRRLHDIGRSGWWVLIAFVPLIGAILLVIWFCQDSRPDNQYGPCPKGNIAR